MNGDQETSESKPETNHSDTTTNGATTAGSAESAGTSSDDLSKQIDRLNNEIAELKDKYVRAYAEMENIRRRQERERTDLLKFALENVFKDLLPVLDSLEKALPEGSDAAKAGVENGASSYYDGMMMVKKQLLEVCKKHGLEGLNAEGAAFDPNLHQAIQRVESPEVDAETVGSEYAKGYILNGRLLRPAMVSVLTPAGS